MKKAVLVKAGLILFAVLLAVLAAGCGDADYPTDEIPSVQYSKDGSLITLRIDGGGDVDRNMSRALTLEMAQKGHDFFEVIFCTNNTASATAQNFTRTSWELGQPARVRNVHRTDAGIEYAPTNFASTSYPDATHGLAVLFIGNKLDKTLLAVGVLESTTYSGTTAPATATTITTNTLTATFKVHALRSGTGYTVSTTTPGVPNYQETTFTTGSFSAPTTVSLGNTSIRKAIFGTNNEFVFPMYLIPDVSGGVNAEYRFGFVGFDSSFPGGTPFTTTTLVSAGNCHPLMAIKLEEDLAGKNIPDEFLRKPRYGDVAIHGPYALQTKAKFGIPTPVDHGSNGLENSALPWPIPIIFETEDIAHGAVSFTFQIPVYAACKEDPDGVPKHTTWYVRPGFGDALFELDNGDSPGGNVPTGGVSSYNGSILIGVGDDITFDYIEVIPGW